MVIAYAWCLQNNSTDNCCLPSGTSFHDLYSHALNAMYLLVLKEGIGREESDDEHNNQKVVANDHEVKNRPDEWFFYGYFFSSSSLNIKKTLHSA